MRVKMDKIKDITKFFALQIQELFDELLEGYHFTKEKATWEEFFFNITYRNKKRYIHFGCTMHPHDYPYYYYLSLGEGASEFPESDWNSIPLWRYFNKEESDKYQQLYDIPCPITEEEIVQKLLTNRSLFETYCRDFLAGELKKFKEFRANVNRGREAYKIYKPDKSGKYNMSFDMISKRLKRIFSRK
jgi:hypothetical protein